MPLHKHIYFLLAAILFIVVSSRDAGAVITNVNLTSAPTPIGLDNYYLAGKQYSFIVTVSEDDPFATTQLYWGTGNIVLNITDGGGRYLRVTIPIATGTPAKSFSNAPDSSIVAVTNNTVAWNSLNYQIDITFAWDTDEYPAAVASTARVDVNETTNGSFGFDQDTNFGVCSSIAVVAPFAQDGVAADGRVNPWHSTFNVTSGTVVYNVTGAGAVHTLADNGINEIINTTLIFNPASTNAPVNSDGDESDGLSFVIPAQFINTTLGASSLGNHTWAVRATMATAGGPKTSNTLAINCDQIRIDSITFINGGGVNPPLPYYRSLNIPGTQIRVNASRQSNPIAGALPMIGLTTITVRNITNGQDFTLQIANNAISGIGNVPNPTVIPAAGSTGIRTYQVYKITGSAFDDEQDLDIGAGRITQTPPNPDVYWDNSDPPGANGAPGTGETPFTAWGGISATASSFTITWTALVAGGPPYDEDFDTYKIYYRETGAPLWKIVDKTTAGYASLGAIGTTTVTITGLKPLTSYDYFITAADIFGQEVDHPLSGASDALYAPPVNASDFGQVLTISTSIAIIITDGITQYSDSANQFETSGLINASNRPLRKTALRVTQYIVTAGAQPESVNIVLAPDNGSGGGPDLVDAGNNLVPPYEKIACSKSGPNTWVGYIPSNNQYMTEGTYCRFIIESISGGVSSFTDANSSNGTEISPGNPNNYEYTFIVKTATTFTPWPTRILNNVITSKNPVCYPAYYLSDDAYVTITAYDIKGRAVATLIDNGFRKGGQNIKEGGWRGENKARKKLGVGLYYIRFEAKRVRDGKKILNETEKLVIAK